MEYKGINLENVKKSNRAAILLALNAQGAMSRKDIAQSVGLTQASVSIIVAELLSQGIVEELGELDEQEKRAGRKKILVNINKTYKYVICVGIEPLETYISIVDLSGELIGSSTLLTAASISPEVFLNQTGDRIKQLLWENNLSKERILAVGVSVPGKVDSDNGISLNTYSIWNEPVDIKGIIEANLGILTIVENNVKAYAQTEIFFGNGTRNEDLFLLKWGPGVGSAMIIGNEIYQGSNKEAGEIGHMIARPKGGALCKCGSRGCLETEVSTHAIIASIMEAYGATEESHAAMPVLDKWLAKGNSMTYRNISNWSVLPDEKLQNIIDEKIDRLALAARNVVRYMDPYRIVVWGYFFEIPQFFERFIAAYRVYDPKVDNEFFVQSQLGAKSQHTEVLAAVLSKMI